MEQVVALAGVRGQVDHRVGGRKLEAIQVERVARRRVGEARAVGRQRLLR